MSSWCQRPLDPLCYTVNFFGNCFVFLHNGASLRGGPRREIVYMTPTFFRLPWSKIDPLSMCKGLSSLAVWRIRGLNLVDSKKIIKFPKKSGVKKFPSPIFEVWSPIFLTTGSRVYPQILTQCRTLRPLLMVKISGKSIRRKLVVFAIDIYPSHSNRLGWILEQRSCYAVLWILLHIPSKRSKCTNQFPVLKTKSS